MKTESDTMVLDKPQAKGTAKPADDNCLPHAAMALGSSRGVGTRPQQTMVSRLVIQEQLGSWVMYRMDDQGGFVGDTWHPTKEDALAEAKREFGVEYSE